MTDRKKIVSYSGPGSQPSTVVVSGFSIDRSITLLAGQTSATLIFSLTNDEIGLEDVESYQLRLTNLSQPVTIGQGGITNIIITDDEGNSVCQCSLCSHLYKTGYLLLF